MRRKGSLVGSGFITVVSGIPRSGTSLMMGMLSAGGLEAVCDSSRVADVHNPLGYYECERVKDLGRNAGVIVGARGKCIKVISELVGFLPRGERYKIIFMLRDLDDVVSSQVDMAGSFAGAGRERLVDVFGRHLLVVRDLIDSREDFLCLYVRFEDALADAFGCACQVRDFLGVRLDVEAMAAAVVVHGRTERDCVCGDGVGDVEDGDSLIRERMLRSLGYL